MMTDCRFYVAKSSN